MYRVNIIAAIGERNRVIGRNNDLPWSKRLTPDMQHFKEKTLGHPVIMGRHTWESIPEKYRPLPHRPNIVITKHERGSIPGAHISHSITGGIECAEYFPGSDEIFVIGGGKVYEKAMRRAHRLYLTLVDEDVEGDTFFPDYSEFSKVISREVVPDFLPRLTFVTLERP